MLQKLYQNFYLILKNFYICPAFGALAQLARVLDWQSRGHRFDSGMLHNTLIYYIENECFNGVCFLF